MRHKIPWRELLFEEFFREHKTVDVRVFTQKRKMENFFSDLRLNPEDIEANIRYFYTFELAPSWIHLWVVFQCFEEKNKDERSSMIEDFLKLLLDTNKRENES